MPMQSFWGVKEVYYGICASSVLQQEAGWATLKKIKMSCNWLKIVQPNSFIEFISTKERNDPRTYLDNLSNCLL